MSEIKRVECSDKYVPEIPAANNERIPLTGALKRLIIEAYRGWKEIEPIFFPASRYYQHLNRQTPKTPQ